MNCCWIGLLPWETRKIALFFFGTALLAVALGAALLTITSIGSQ